MSIERQIFSLKQVVSSIRKTIEERYAQTYWMKAEIYKFNRFPSGHAFPEIVQRENDKIVAQLSGTIWKQNYERINQQFIEEETVPNDAIVIKRVWAKSNADGSQDRRFKNKWKY